MEERKCPNCDSTEIGNAKFASDVKLVPINAWTTFHGQEVFADVCLKCGYILHLWASNPEMLK